MSSGQVNGAGQTGTMSVNPVQAAMFALQFLESVPHTRAQREAYDMSVGMLQAIASGQVVLAPPNAMPAPTSDEPARPQ